MAYRSRVLAVLRDLHRAKREVFEGDAHALSVVTQRIRDEFRKNVPETSTAKIEENLTLATDVATLLRKTVVQCKQKDAETFELRLTKNTELQKNNSVYDPTKEIPFKPRRKKCSSDMELGDKG